MILGKKLVSGFTLIEVVVVMCIIGVLGMMIAPAYAGYVDKARERVCEVRCLEMERMYEGQLVLENKGHSDMDFNIFMIEHNEDICPTKGNITYVDGKVICDIHQESEDSGEELPIL